MRTGTRMTGRQFMTLLQKKQLCATAPLLFEIELALAIYWLAPPQVMTYADTHQPIEIAFGVRTSLSSPFIGWLRRN
jgi:hypothetical protein